ncbi:myrosinase 1-like [Anticarsia gemmatalis]|uniref:myrosinase 1-like n=1 Tax=Anticarsia gemmatalis TaxID=129554 RepID=UPI003F769282
MKISLILFCLGLVLTDAAVIKQNKRFPDDFFFGTGTSAYQIEGGWDADDKGDSIWDYMTHNMPEVITDHSNGDIAADSFNNYKRDVEMMRELGLDMYRFSLSWPRILPTGVPNYVSEAGITYYNNLIDEMLKYNIQPMITLYHWDLPQKLQEMGGFMNPLIADWFEDFARIAYERFGDRVKYWITFNEGYQICYEGYDYVSKAPRLNATGVGEYLCARNLLLAHARAYHAYNNDFRPTQGGICGYTISISSAQPLNDTEEDRLALELHTQAEWAIYTDPIFSKEGGFPKELSELVAEKSANQGFPRSRLPAFSEEEKEFIKGTSDFFGVNHYGGGYVSFSLYDLENSVVPSTQDDIQVGSYAPEDWPQAASFWLKRMPRSLYIVLKRIHERYDGNVPIIVTENGWSTHAGIEDEDRVAYYRAALEGALDAMDEGVNLLGYFAWSLLDNFEWMAGYSERFGLYEVDFEDPARTRTPRKSAFIYKQIIKTRVVDHGYEPHSYVMTIDEGH